MSFAVFLRYGVACWLEDDSSKRRRQNCHEDDRCCIVRNHVVGAPNRAGRSKIVCKSEDKQVEGACRQNQKSSEYQKVKSAGYSIARMLPLSEPILQQRLRAQPGAIQPEVAFSPKEGRQPPRHDKNEARETKNLNNRHQSLH